jgi:hypothetical protein
LALLQGIPLQVVGAGSFANHVLKNFMGVGKAAMLCGALMSFLCEMTNATVA